MRRRAGIAFVTILIALGISVAGARWLKSNSLDAEAEKIRKSINPDELRSWAFLIAEQYSSQVPANRSYIVVSGPYPEFLKEIPPPAAPWSVLVSAKGREGTPYVSILSFGGFASYAIEIGSTNFVKSSAYHATQIAPGIFFGASR